jgi:hypothetical protein
MDSALIDSLRHRLQNYGSAVEGTKAHFQEMVHCGTRPAYAPYYERARTLAHFDAIAEDGGGIPSEMWREYSRITRRFETFEQEAGPAYRRTLLNELAGFTQAYQAALCYAYLGEPVDPSVRQPAEREIIGVLLNELKKDHDLSEIERLITSLDENVASITGTPQEPEPVTNTRIRSTTCDTVWRCDRGTP